jgi:hypothetical protein
VLFNCVTRNYGALADAAPEGEQGSDDYQADFDCRTGFNSRYDRLYVTDVTTYYPDGHGRDQKMLCYTSRPLESDTEVTDPKRHGGGNTLGAGTFSRVPGTRPSDDERAIARVQGRALAETARAWKERRQD